MSIATKHRHLRKFVILIGLVIVLGTAAATLTPQTASATRVRYMTWNRYDILLDNDTRAAATSYGGALFVCRGAIAGAAAAGGTLGVLVASVLCPAIVTTCAAQAYYKGRWAGITVTPLPFLNYWCWTY